jgi:hypothetical protein
LYFLYICGISFANSGNRLWKAQKPLEGRGVEPPALPQILCNRSSVPSSGHIEKPIPRRGWAQAAKTAQSGCAAVQAVETRGLILNCGNYRARGCVLS